MFAYTKSFHAKVLHDLEITQTLSFVDFINVQPNSRFKIINDPNVESEIPYRLALDLPDSTMLIDRKLTSIYKFMYILYLYLVTVEQSRDYPYFVFVSDDASDYSDLMMRIYQHPILRKFIDLQNKNTENHKYVVLSKVQCAFTFANVTIVNRHSNIMSVFKSKYMASVLFLSDDSNLKHYLSDNFRRQCTSLMPKSKLPTEFLAPER